MPSIWFGQERKSGPTTSCLHRRSTSAKVSLAGLVLMKLMPNRDLDRVHLRDMIDVDLVGRDLLEELPPELAARLDALLTESGR